MVIQHNLQSLFTSMQIGQTERSRAKTQEKLASGYKINRAADNAAGLEISEKMRRQIRGLTRAAVNGKDGISFVQIADGALEEVHDMLQRGNELAVQAANGTNPASDREAINNEIIELKKEIDRVAETSKFNEIKIFSKQGMLPPTTITDAEIEEKAIKSELDKLADKVAEEYFPNAVKQMLDKMPWFNEIIQEGIKNNPNLYDTTLKVVYIDGKGGKAGATMGAGFTWPEQKFEAGSLVMSIDKDDYPSLNMYPSTLSYFEGTVAHETMHVIWQQTEMMLLRKISLMVRETCSGACEKIMMIALET